MTAVRDTRLAFCSLGAPGASVADLAAAADASGVHLVELRCADGELLSPEMSLDDASARGRELAAAGVDVLCVASYVRIARPDGDPVAEAVKHVRLAEAAGSPYVRLFGGVEGKAEDPRVAARRIADVVARTAGSDVTLLLETHDVFLRGEQIAGILDEADRIEPRVRERAGALWDVVNPWRAGEEPERTAAALATWLRHVQIKDAASPTELAPVLPGSGAVPLDRIFAALDDVGYDGVLSLEWERAWYPDAAPLEVALAAFRELIDAR